MDTRLTAQRRREKDRYTVLEAAHILGIEYETLRYHLRTGLVGRPRRGNGLRKYYTSRDVQRIKHEMEEQCNASTKRPMQ